MFTGIFMSKIKVKKKLDIYLTLVYNNSMVKERNLNDLIEGDGEMKYKITSKKTGEIKIDDIKYNVYDNKVKLTNWQILDREWIEEVADDNSGQLISVQPLTFWFPDTIKSGTDCVEIDNFITNLERAIKQELAG